VTRELWGRSANAKREIAFVMGSRGLV
jgi:hypothetical protein